MKGYLKSTLRHEFLNHDARYLLCIANELQGNLELQRDIERLGGVSRHDGFQFVSRRGRNMAAAIITQRWGYDATELLDLPQSLDEDGMPALKSPRVLLVSLGEDCLLDWYRELQSRNIDIQVSTHGLQCAEALKSFRPTVMLIDEELLWGPRESNTDIDYPPVRIALLTDDDWPHRYSLKSPHGGTLPSATSPEELLEQLSEHFYLDSE